MYRIPERAGWNSDTLGWDVVTWISPTRTEWLLANVKSEGCMRSACGQAIVKLDIYQPPASPPASVSLMLQFASPLRATKNRNTSSTTSTIAPLPTPQLRQQNQKQAQQQHVTKATAATEQQQQQRNKSNNNNNNNTSWTRLWCRGNLRQSSGAGSNIPKAQGVLFGTEIGTLAKASVHVIWDSIQKIPIDQWPKPYVIIFMIDIFILYFKYKIHGTT